MEFTFLHNFVHFAKTVKERNLLSGWLLLVATTTIVILAINSIFN